MTYASETKIVNEFTTRSGYRIIVKQMPSEQVTQVFSATAYNDHAIVASAVAMRQQTAEDLCINELCRNLIVVS